VKVADYAKLKVFNRRDFRTQSSGWKCLDVDESRFKQVEYR